MTVDMSDSLPAQPNHGVVPSDHQPAVAMRKMSWNPSSVAQGLSYPCSTGSGADSNTIDKGGDDFGLCRVSWLRPGQSA